MLSEMGDDHLVAPSKNILLSMGEAVKTFRKQNRISQKELAKVSGISQSNISQLERGKYNISLLKLEQLLSSMGGYLKMEVVADERKLS